MTCLALHLHSSLLPMHAKLKPQQLHMGQTTKLLSGELIRTVPQSQQHIPSASLLRTKALPHFVVVAATATAPPKSGDLSSFLPISALLLSVYFIANFVVPDLLTKYFGFDKLNKDQKVDDVDAIEDK